MAFEHADKLEFDEDPLHLLTDRARHEHLTRKIPLHVLLIALVAAFARRLTSPRRAA